MKRPTRKDCWPLALYIVGAIGILIALGACHSGGFLGIFGDSPRSAGKVHSTSAGEAATFGTLKSMSWAFIVPGIIMAAASYWVPPMRRLAGYLIAAGVVAALLPWTLEVFGKPAIWISLGLGVVIAGLWIWGHRKRIMQGDIT